MAKLVNVEDYHQIASKKLTPLAYSYYSSGADDQITLKKTQNDFNKIQVIPRVLVDVSKIDLSVEIFGHKLNMPIMIAPTAMHKLANREGEVATARAAKAKGTLFTLSSLSTTKMQDIASIDGPRWFQLYVLKERKITEKIVRKAEENGFTALVLTVDTPVLGRRLQDIRNGFKLPDDMQLEIFVDAGVKDLANLPTGLLGFVATLLDQSLDWSAIEWLKSITKLPIIIKGVLHPDDAVLAVKHGADGIIVSNHGARQLDTVPSTIEVLPLIVNAVSGKVPVLFDGGIRRGSDIMKALAYGAKAVMLGRPVLWGLSANGEEGVKEILTILHDELKSCVALAGCTKVSDITRDLIYDRRRFARL